MIELGAHIALEAAYRIEARRVRATLIRLLGDFDAAEEALHEAFAVAAERWPKEGVPSNTYSWLVSVGRFKTVDGWRRGARLASALQRFGALAEPAPEVTMPEPIEDDELRLIFICCHPVLPTDARIALTLREVAGLTTEQIARAYFVRAPTIGQRIVRAKPCSRLSTSPSTRATPQPTAKPWRGLIFVQRRYGSAG
jgi:RNA polymerase sigma-70 factor (ECF subfamily)